MVTYKLHLIRHGMTEGNRTGRYVGRMDLPVCLEGRQQLEEMKKKYDYPYVQEVNSRVKVSILLKIIPLISRGYPILLTILLPEHVRPERNLLVE